MSIPLMCATSRAFPDLPFAGCCHDAVPSETSPWCSAEPVPVVGQDMLWDPGSSAGTLAIVDVPCACISCTVSWPGVW